MEPTAHAYLGLSPAGFHRNTYWEWPAPSGDAPTLLMVHGLTRNGRDFDWIARTLADRRRVVCPDVVGRGRSDRLASPAFYTYPQYCADAAALIARLGVDAVDWLGTSMGGLIGMTLAAMPGTPIRRLILNDVGPLVPKPALERIATYVGQDPVFASPDELEAYLRRAHAPFGPLTDEQWAHLARHSARQVEGAWCLAYDPAIGDAFRAGPLDEVDLWSVWDAVRCPVLVLRGGSSDLLLPETAAQMVRRKPGTVVVEFPECGHAPALMDAGQIAVVADWLAHHPAGGR